MSERKAHDDELLPSYDFSSAVKGKHAARYRKDAPVTLVKEAAKRVAPKRKAIVLRRATGEAKRAERSKK